MKRYFSLILAIAATVSAQIVPSTGNVRGPTSATDNAVARYDGTTGKLIQNSGVTIDDSGNLTVSGTGTFSNTSASTPTIALNTTQTSTGLSFLSTIGGAPSSERNWAILTNAGAYGDFVIRSSNAQGGNPITAGATALTIDNSNNATFTGTVQANGGTASINHTASAANILFKATGSQYAEINANSATGEFSINSGPSAGWGGFLTWKTDTTEKMRISNSGSLKLSAYGAGTLTTDSSGNVTATSDERAKNITGTFTKGLAEVVKLTPKTYTWKPETGLNTTDEVASLTAQDLIAAGIPEAVSTYRTVADVDEDGKQKVDADGKPLTKRIDATYTVSDRAVIAALVNAVKELKAEVDALKAARN